MTSPRIAEIGPDADDVITLTRDLVRIPSPRGDEHAIVGRIAAYLEELGWSVDQSDGRNLFGASAPDVDLAFLAYLDSPPSGAMDDPFGAAVVGPSEERVIRGRGALTKGPLAAAMAACRYVARQRPNARLGLVATTEDNIGLRTVLAGRAANIRRAIVTEPTDCAVGVRARGIVWLDITIEGRAAHAGSATAAANPVEVLADLVSALRSLAHPAEDGLERAPYTPMSVTTVGDWPRTPTTARLRLDRRTFASETVNDLQAEVARALRVACASHDGTSGRVEVAGEMNAFAADARSEIVRLARESSTTVTGREPPEIALPFATNAGCASALGIDCVALGPGRIADVGDEEAVGVARLIEATRVYATIADRST